MKNKDIKLDIGSLSEGFGKALKKVGAYKAFIFFLVVAGLYGFIVWRINTYSSVAPSQSEESAQIAARPHIDPDTVKKLEDLQNNSVSVQALFNQARQNPFQE